MEEGHVWEYLTKLEVRNSVCPDEIYPQVLRELASVILTPLSIIFERSWQLGQVLQNWRKAQPFLHKGQGEPSKLQACQPHLGHLME